MKRQADKHICRYNDSQTSEIAYITPGAEYGFTGHQEIVIRWRGIFIKKTVWSESTLRQSIIGSMNH